MEGYRLGITERLRLIHKEENAVERLDGRRTLFEGTAMAALDPDVRWNPAFVKLPMTNGMDISGLPPLPVDQVGTWLGLGLTDAGVVSAGLC